MGDGFCDAYGTCARVTVMIFTAAGLAFSILAAQSCEFIEFSGVVGLNTGAAGLFSYTDPNGAGCVEYPADATIEPTDNTARVCGALAAFFGFIALCLILFEFCICKLWCARCLLSGVYAVAYVCQGITFLIYNNGTFCTAGGTNCSWGQGSTWSVLALILYFISSCIMCCTPRPDPLLCKHREHKKEEKKAQEMADEITAKDKAASSAEKGASAGAGDDSPPKHAGGSTGDEAAAHASAY
jgi:hypothetical protein